MVFWDVLEKILSYSQYAILIVLLIFYLAFNEKIKIRENFLILIGAIFFHGVVNIFIGNESIALLVKQAGVISACFIAYDNILSKVRVKYIFKIYFNAAFFMSVSGIIMQILSFLKGDFYYRMMSFCSEPSFLCYFLAPIVSVIIFAIIVPEIGNSYKTPKRIKARAIVIFFAYLMTFSAIAYLGLVLMFFLAFNKKGTSVGKFLIPFFVILLACTVYMNVPDIKMRIDDTLSIFNKADKTSVNLSSYTLYNNLQVSLKAFKNNHGLGCGLGGYQNMFDKYSLSSGNDVLNVYQLNREDANSAFLRILTELGFAGSALVFWWLHHFHVKGKSIHSVFSNAILSCLILLLIRQGNYVHGGTVMLWVLYMKIYKESNNLKMVKRK